MPGSVFEGAWEEKIVRAAGRAQIFEAANKYAESMLAVQRQYAAWAGLEMLGRQVAELEAKLAASIARASCVVIDRLGRRTAFEDALDREGSGWRSVPPDPAQRAVVS